MEFTPSDITLALFTGLIAGLSSYFAAYSKVKAEVRAATEELTQTIRNLTATTRAVEVEKAKISAHSALMSDQRKAVYALSTATQSLIHSMCWLSWDTRIRGLARPEMMKAYDIEAHKLLPEIFSQLALLRLLDSDLQARKYPSLLDTDSQMPATPLLLDADLHTRAYPFAARLAQLDVEFGEAIVLADSDATLGAAALRNLYQKANDLQFAIDELFGANPDVPGQRRNAGAVV
jgi:hypothetical protein